MNKKKKKKYYKHIYTYLSMLKVKVSSPIYIADCDFFFRKKQK